MKKLFVLLFAGAVLASCGGSGYTTDQEEVVSGYDDMKEDAQGYYDDLLEIEKSWAEDKKEMLKDYEGDVNKLREKAAKDDDAKGALEDYRNAQYDYLKKKSEREEDWTWANWGITTAKSDMEKMLEGDAKKKFQKDIKKSQDAIDKIEKKYNEEVKKLKKD